MDFNQIVILLIIGFLAGAVSGVMGVGGAIIMIPAMVFFLGLTQHQAQGTSLAVLLFPVGIFAVWNYYKKGFVNFNYAIVLIIAFVAGSYLGSLFSVDLPSNVLRKIFGILLVALGIQMFFK